MQNSKLSHPIYFAESKVESPLDVINLFIEYFVFYSWMFFKNRPRGNLFLLRAILTVATFGFLYYRFFSRFELVLAGVEIDPVILMFGMTCISYLVMSSIFHNKSRECSHLYHEYLKAFGAKKFEQAELQAANLGITLLTLDLWGHRHFSMVFTSTFQKALELSKDSSALLEKVQLGKMSTREARTLLENYQANLMSTIEVKG